MQDLIASIAAKAGISEDIAKQAVSIILSFLAKEGPNDKAATLLDAMPGASELVAGELVAGDADDSDGGGMLGGLMGGGGVMGAFNELSSLGLGMGEVQTATLETVTYAKAQAGEDTVDDIIGSIPGLSQFL